MSDMPFQRTYEALVDNLCLGFDECDKEWREKLLIAQEVVGQMAWTERTVRDLAEMDSRLIMHGAINGL